MDQSQKRSISISGRGWALVSVVSVAVLVTKILKIDIFTSQNLLCNLTHFRDGIGSVLGVGRYWKRSIGIGIGNGILVSVHPYLLGALCWSSSPLDFGCCDPALLHCSWSESMLMNIEMYILQCNLGLLCNMYLRALLFMLGIQSVCDEITFTT